MLEGHWSDSIYLSESGKKDLVYAPTNKHRIGGWGTEMGLSDSEATDVLNNSIQGGKQRYGYKEGKLYEFQPDNTGGWHGCPVIGTEVPPSVLKQMRDGGQITNAQYRKLIKGKGN